jgi:hypothetical protein
MADPHIPDGANILTSASSQQQVGLYIDNYHYKLSRPL